MKNVRHIALLSNRRRFQDNQTTCKGLSFALFGSVLGMQSDFSLTSPCFPILHLAILVHEAAVVKPYCVRKRTLFRPRWSRNGLP